MVPVIFAAPAWLDARDSDSDDDRAVLNASSSSPSHSSSSSSSSSAVVSERAFADLRRLLLAELSDPGGVQPHFAALRTVANMVTHNAALMEALLGAMSSSLAAASEQEDETERVLELLFRFVALHSQDDTLAASRRVVACGALADAVHCAAVVVSIRRSVPALTSWFIRQATLGSLAAPDLSCGLIRAARRSVPPSTSSDVALNVLAQMQTEAWLAVSAAKQQHHKRHASSPPSSSSHHQPHTTVFTSSAASLMMGVNNSNGGIVGRRQQQQQHSSSAAPPAASSVVIDPNASESFVSLQQSSDSPAPASASSPAAGCVFVQVGDGSNPNVSLLLWGEDDNDKSERATHRHHNKKRKSGLPELLTPRYRIAHELALLQHHRQTKELTSWIYLLLHNAAFHPKVGGSAGSGSVGDFLDAALAFASALCPKARRQAGEAASSLSFLGAPSHSSTANNNNAASVSPFLLVEHSVLPVEARAMLGAGLAIALAWARIRGAASDDRELLFFTRHFHGLAQNVDAAVDELYRRCAGGSMTEWLASGLLNTWPAVCRFLGVCDLAPDGGISEFLAGRVPRAGLGPRFELLSCWCEH